MRSRRRSCIRLQAGERIPEEDFHLSDHTRFRRTYLTLPTHYTKPIGIGVAAVTSEELCLARGADKSNPKRKT